MPDHVLLNKRAPRPEYKRLTNDISYAVGYQFGKVKGGREAIVEHLTVLIDDEKERSAAIAKAWVLGDQELAQFMRGILERKRPGLERAERDLEKKKRRMERHIQALDEVADWLDGEMRLEAVAESRLHVALAAERIRQTADDPFDYDTVAAGAQVFLIQHDWAALLKGCDVDDGNYRLPFERCVFEASVSGRRICFFVVCDNGEPAVVGEMIQCGNLWIEARGSEPKSHSGHLVLEQIRAIAICLDAEVVKTDPVRAPHLENQKRERRGLPPIYSHHVMSLAKRSRASRLPDSEPSGFRRRLHFRRGHWRHFSTFKTWVRWCLVGDASIGFADKDYAL